MRRSETLNHADLLTFPPSNPLIFRDICVYLCLFVVSLILFPLFSLLFPIFCSKILVIE